MAQPLLGSLLAIASALFYGSGDFTGGRAARRHHSWQVLALVEAAGAVFMVALALLWQEPWPTVRSAVAGGAAGMVAAVGLMLIYRGLALGRAAVVSPVAAVVSACVPVVFGALALGLPGERQAVGFVVALLGIWLVTRQSSSEAADGKGGFLLGVSAGISFGLFYVIIAEVAEGSVFWPLVVGRLAGLGLVLVMLRHHSLPFPLPSANPLAVFSAALDSSANACYLLASQLVRTDVAAVLTSIYPAVTVVLSATLIKERVVRAQWVGVFLCICAMVLIAF